MDRNKAIFLDRDGTINVEKNYLHRIEDFEFLPGAVEAMSIMTEMGYKLVVVTNQSGIARGYYTEADYLRLNAWMMEKLERHGIVISGTYYCPHLPDAVVEEYRFDCNCRKPKLGLYDRAIIEQGLDIHQCIAIGDKDRDIAVARKYNIPGYRIYAESEMHEANIWNIKGGLLQVARIIGDGVSS